MKQAVDEKHFPAGLQRSGHKFPESLKAVGRNVRQPEAEEDEVILPGRLPVEQIGLDAADVCRIDTLAVQPQCFR